MNPTLPIHTVLNELNTALVKHDNVVLSAPPGAGKTTQVPLALIKEEWCTQKVVMFEPRRMAARAAAHRLAELLGENAGQTVGYRIKGETRISAQTRIEVVTGGVLSRMLISNPALEGYSAVVLDEFHERNLDADLSLALTLAARELFRENAPLKLLIMSATLDAEAITQMLQAPYVVSEGRTHPVDIQYLGHTPKDAMVNVAAQATHKALNTSKGHVLVFLPGQKIINQLQRALTGAVPQTVCVMPLYGALPFKEQQKALAPPAPPYAKKVILATDVAETSLTFEGVTAVIDTGYHHAPAYCPKSAMTRLQTRRISKASATQRAGRAGRTAPGVCYRLWAKEQTLEAHSAPEITQADLAPLALQLLAFGVSTPDELTWLTPPPKAAFSQAIDLLKQLQAVTKNADALTAHGQALTQTGTHPRLSHMIQSAIPLNAARQATQLAALFSENTLQLNTNDIDHALERWQSLPKAFHQTQAQLFNALKVKNQDETLPAGALVALAYPDRIAKQTITSTYKLSNGRMASLTSSSPLSKSAWLAVAVVGGSVGKSEDKIFLGATITLEQIKNTLPEQIKTQDRLEWNEQQQRFTAEKVTYLGALELETKPLDNLPNEKRLNAILAFISNKHLAPLTWSKAAKQLRARTALLKNTITEHPKVKNLPDLSDEHLVQNIQDWLGPFIGNANTLQALKKINIEEALINYLGWDALQTLNSLAPTHVTVPSGSEISIDYSHSPPVLAVKLQEMFGSTTTPSVAQSKIALVLHLLSPAGRPLQITQDLVHFWHHSYFDVKKDMKGRYPKHPWPEDPLKAIATKKTKRHLKPQS